MSLSLTSRDPRRTGDDPAGTAVPTRPDRVADGRPWTQRTVEAITRRLSGSRMGRRSFLTRSALVGSALAVDPIGFVLKPRTAWASVCGDDNEFHEGWSAFCATINDGANTCPKGSYPAGWWKIDNTAFCSGRARYIVDCNRRPGASCGCRAANGKCDHRRVCCNNFRYGQCNTHVSGTTEVVCRIVLCTPPWKWGNCTTTSATANATRSHWSSRLPSRTNPTDIKVRWLEMGLTGSVLGDMRGSERRADDGGRWARFDRGVLTKRPNTSATRLLLGPHAAKYAAVGGPDSRLGYPRSDVRNNPLVARYQGGSTYRTPDGVVALWGGVDLHYRYQGGPGGWMGRPIDRIDERGRFEMVKTLSGWWVVRSNAEDDTRVLRGVDNLPGDGRWPATVDVDRWSGDNRYQTAVEVSRRAYPDGCDTVLVVRGDDYPDATAAGAVAARLGAPILLTARAQLPSATIGEIRRLSPRRAIILGGGSAVAGKVARQLRTLVDDVDRWAGDNRYQTAVEVSRQVFPDGSDVAVLASGLGFPDSLTVAPQAHRLGAPVLLTDPDRIPRTVAAELRRLSPRRVVIAGGGKAVSGRVARRLRDDFGVRTSRLAGATRYDTSADIADALGGAGTVMVTTGRDFPDGLAAAGWANARRVPILLADDFIFDRVDRAIRRRGPRRVIVLGGTDAVSNSLVHQLQGYRVH